MFLFRRFKEKKMNSKRKLFSICLCCGAILERPENMKRYVQCIECQKKGNSKLLELSAFRAKFDEMTIREGKAMPDAAFVHVYDSLFRAPTPAAIAQVAKARTRTLKKCK